jgi:hypothetical protein
MDCALSRRIGPMREVTLAISQTLRLTESLARSASFQWLEPLATEEFGEEANLVGG